jgi:predicted DNA binding protein
LQKEIHLRFSRRGHWLQDASQRLPNTTFIISSLYEYGDDVHLSILVLGASAKDQQALQNEWRQHPEISRVDGPFEDPRGASFQFVYPKKNSLYPLLASHHLFDFRFSAVAQGHQYLSVVGDSGEVQSLIKEIEKLGHVEILSVRQVSGNLQPKEASPVGGLFDRLSEHQLGALVLAWDRDYFSWPRKVTASQLAQSIGLTTPSFLHHLRQAEDKLIRGALEELRRTRPAQIEASRSIAMRGGAAQRRGGDASRPAPKKKPTP